MGETCLTCKRGRPPDGLAAQEQDQRPETVALIPTARRRRAKRTLARDGRLRARFSCGADHQGLYSHMETAMMVI